MPCRQAPGVDSLPPGSGQSLALRPSGEIPSLYMDTDDALFYSHPEARQTLYPDIADLRSAEGLWRRGNISF